jgi:hypothetical protein
MESPAPHFVILVLVTRIPAAQAFEIVRIVARLEAVGDARDKPAHDVGKGTCATHDPLS